MPELRHDALTGRLVLLAPGRSSRPHTASTDSLAPLDSLAAARGTRAADVRSSGASARLSSDACPFCPGHERDTPPEVARTGSGGPGEPGWRVRAFPNLYPIVGGPQASAGATGAHEVVALSPDHDRAFGALTHDEAAEVVTMLRDRARAHVHDGRQHVQVLVNEGRSAGASIAHPHAQVVALDFVPPAVSVATERFTAAGSDLVLSDLADAGARGLGVVTGDEVAAWCPSGSAAPFEVRIAAVGATARFDEATDAHVLGVAVVLRDVLAAIARGLDDPPYNVMVHTAEAAPSVGGHWWVEVTPRIAVVAGFELATGVLVNTVPPEDAAERLRAAL